MPIVNAATLLFTNFPTGLQEGMRFRYSLIAFSDWPGALSEKERMPIPISPANSKVLGLTPETQRGGCGSWMGWGRIARSGQLQYFPWCSTVSSVHIFGRRR